MYGANFDQAQGVTIFLLRTTLYVATSALSKRLKICCFWKMLERSSGGETMREKKGEVDRGERKERGREEKNKGRREIYRDLLLN